MSELAQFFQLFQTKVSKEDDEVNQEDPRLSAYAFTNTLATLDGVNTIKTGQFIAYQYLTREICYHHKAPTPTMWKALYRFCFQNPLLTDDDYNSKALAPKSTGRGKEVSTKYGLFVVQNMLFGDQYLSFWRVCLTKIPRFWSPNSCYFGECV